MLVICNLADNAFKGICGLSDLPCLKNASRTLKSIHYASLFDNKVIKVLRDKGIDCDCPSGKIHFLLEFLNIIFTRTLDIYF